MFEKQDDLLMFLDCARVAAQWHLNQNKVVSFYDESLREQLNKEDNLIHDFNRALKKKSMKYFFNHNWVEMFFIKLV